MIRGQHRYFSAAVRRNSKWVAANKAERIARTGGAKILDLARQGHIEAVFLAGRRDGNRTECWIQRQSLNRWIAARDAELARYMLRREAKSALGLTNTTIVKIAAAGAIRYVKGPEQNFPVGFFFFLKEDVMKIKQAFENHVVAAKGYFKPGELITLRHAIKNYLGRDSALVAVIRAVIDGSLVPVGYANRCRGITGYLFRSEDLRKYRPVPEVKACPEALLNFRETSSLLGVRSNVVRGLVAQCLLTVAAGCQNGFSRLVPESEVHLFAERYVATSVLASRFHLNSGSLARHLRESGTPLLAIPVPDDGKGHAFFLRKDVAAQIRPPSRMALREQAQRRIKTARKERWAAYRLAKEIASGKPCDESVRIGQARLLCPRGTGEETREGSVLVTARDPSPYRGIAT